MKAMIFAAGVGSRLAPLTDNCPKALIEVGGKPMLEHVITKLKGAGISRMVVNIHHHAAMIRDFLEAKENFGIEISLSDESDHLLDTGGGVAKAAPLLLNGTDEPILLHNADILTDFPLGPMIRQHESTGADATLLVSPQRQSSRVLLFDNDQLTGWRNNNTGEVKSPYADTSGSIPMAFGGVHIISPRIVTDLVKAAEQKTVFSITPYYYTNCDRLDIRAHIPASSYRWADIGRPETLARARREWA